MKNESNNLSSKDIRNALERELGHIKLSSQMKRDIVYNARHSKKPSASRHAARYAWAAAAVVVLMCATLPFTRGRINPDPQINRPIRRNNPSPVLAASGTENPAPIAAEATPVPGEMTDLFLRFENEIILPVDAAGELVWSTKNGRFYHLVEDCSGMQDAFTLSRNEASLAGKQPCPVCIAFVTPTPVPEEPLATQEPAYRFYGTEHGTYFHTDETCSGMQNAVWLADLSGKQPCPVCIPYVTPTPVPVEVITTPEPTEIPEVVIFDATVTPEPTPMPAPMFFGTAHGTFYHINETCSGMENAVWLSDLTGKQPCPVCIPGEIAEPTEMPMDASYDVVYDVSATPEPAAQIWYGTEQDSCFHRVSDCSGLGNAPQLADLTGKLPCPYCVTYLSYSDGDVRRAYHHSDFYGTEHGTFYHLEENCSGMENAVQLSDLTEKQPCPVCILGAIFYPMAAPTPEPIQAPGTEAFAIFRGTPEGKYYHMAEDCSGMKNTAWISRLDNRQPCPNCIGNSFWMLPEAAYFHLDEHCSGMENALSVDSAEAGNAGKQPCPVCMGIVIDAAADSNTGVGMNSIIGVNRYTLDDGCIMELEYVADPEFKFIDEPDTTNWYVDEVESPEYFFEEYLDHRLPDEYIAQLKIAYEKNGRAGYEVRDTLIMLNGVNTEFSSDSGDVPSGKEYRFDDTENPFRECVLYVLDRPYEGSTAEVTVVERLMQWWFDGEKVYRLTRDHNIVDESLSIVIGDGGKVIPVHEKVGFFGLEADAAGYLLGSNHYAIMEYDESLALYESELISVSGDIFKPEMTTDPTFHVNKVTGWRYPAETADYIDVLRLSDGESSVDIPMNPEGSLSLAIAKLAELLSDCGVTDAETVNNTVASLILIGENGDITAMASQPIREELLKAGLSEDAIASNYMVSSVLAILDGDLDYDPAG